MLQRALYLLKTYVLTVLFFVAAKVAFMWYNAADHPFSVGDVMDVVNHGITLDFSTSLYFLIIPFLCCIASIFLRRPHPLRLLLRAYYALVAVAFALAFVADTSLYEFWHFKLDVSCLQYLETPTEAMASVSTPYLVVRALLLIVLASAMYWAYTHPRWTVNPSRHRITELLVSVLCIPLIVVGIRGGLDESTTNIGQVYYSQNQFLNHSAVNPVFSFLASFEKSANNIVDYDYYSDAECQQLMQGLYDTDVSFTDTLLTTSRPDIVVILMESAGSVFTAAAGRQDIMPHLNRLMQEGVYFEQCYANTWRTDRGTVCTWSGYPSFPTSSVMKMPRKTRYLPGMARTLQQAGYQTCYLYGGDINFTNMRSYLLSTGFDSLVWKRDYTAEQQATAKWGVRDDITFETLYSLLDKPSAKPKLIGFSTLSSHEPWDVPSQQLDEPMANAFRYLDDCIGSFLQRLQSSAHWQNTLVVLLPDHSIGYREAMDETSLMRNRIPVIWTGGAVRGPHRVTTLCNQTDLAATLLTQLGLPAGDFVFSRNVLSPSYRYPFAVHNFNNGFTVIDSTGFTVFDLNVGRTMGGNSPDSQRLERMGKAILQTTTKHLKAL